MLWPDCADSRPTYSLDWARPCELAPSLLVQRVLDYDLQRFDFVGAVESVFGVSKLVDIHLEPTRSPAETPPALRRGQIQARVGLKVSKEESKAALNHARQHELMPANQAFLELYRRFVATWVVPQLGCSVLYQKKPILRVVLPGSVPPSELHCDADYFHDANEINFWVPITPVWGSNSLWAESFVPSAASNAPKTTGPSLPPLINPVLIPPFCLHIPPNRAAGVGDFAPFEALPGQAVRFYGNRCRHYTVGNETGATRVSFDFRVRDLLLEASHACRTMIDLTPLLLSLLSF